jgi:hypothetical protein
MNEATYVSGPNPQHRMIAGRPRALLLELLRTKSEKYVVRQPVRTAPQIVTSSTSNKIACFVFFTMSQSPESVFAHEGVRWSFSEETLYLTIQQQWKESRVQKKWPVISGAGTNRAWGDQR